jgi:hypothetical protein
MASQGRCCPSWSRTTLTVKAAAAGASRSDGLSLTMTLHRQGAEISRRGYGGVVEHELGVVGAKPASSR